MKILFVSMNSIHFRRWSDQLRDSGHDVYWFDILDQGYAPSMSWMTQITDWKKGFLKKRGRTALKNKLPRLYNALVHKYDTPVDVAFAKALETIKPDLVHSFALQISCLPIYEVMLQKVNIKWLYISWGTDLFLPESLGMHVDYMKSILNRVDFLITDCHRDYEIAVHAGFGGKFIGVFPGNGGIDFKPRQPTAIEPKGILIKAYQDDYGRGDMIAQAILNLIEYLKETTIYFVGASQNPIYKKLEIWENVTIYPRHTILSQEQLFRIYEKCFIYCAFSISDGLPNMLIEAMGYGLFPIQSNPGNVMLEIIEDEKTGYLLPVNSEIDALQIKIARAVEHKALITAQMKETSAIIQLKYNRLQWKSKILEAYEFVNSST